MPLALNTRGQRLAKRDGAVTLSDLTALGLRPADVLSTIAVSLRLARPAEHVSPAQLLDRFDPELLPREPWIVRPARQ